MIFPKSCHDRHIYSNTPKLTPYDPTGRIHSACSDILSMNRDNPIPAILPGSAISQKNEPAVDSQLIFYRKTGQKLKLNSYLWEKDR